MKIVYSNNIIITKLVYIQNLLSFIEFINHLILLYFSPSFTVVILSSTHMMVPKIKNHIIRVF